MAAVMSVHAPYRLGEAKEEETGLRSVSARGWMERVCAYRLPKQKGKRRGAATATGPRRNNPAL